MPRRAHRRPLRAPTNLICRRSARGAMQGPFVCRLCGRNFAPYAATRQVYCKRCRARAEREANKVLRVRCKECGKTFSTTSRAVRYCSEECRRAVRARQRNAPRRRRPARDETTKCRTCGKVFKPDRKPGSPLVYCSLACRAEGRRRLSREAMRRYVADPEKRALTAARTRAAAARRKARKKRGER